VVAYVKVVIFQKSMATALWWRMIFGMSGAEGFGFQLAHLPLLHCGILGHHERVICHLFCTSVQSSLTGNGDPTPAGALLVDFAVCRSSCA